MISWTVGMEPSLSHFILLYGHVIIFYSQIALCMFVNYPIAL